MVGIPSFPLGKPYFQGGIDPATWDQVASKAVQRAEAALESKLGDGEYGDMF